MSLQNLQRERDSRQIIMGESKEEKLPLSPKGRGTGTGRGGGYKTHAKGRKISFYPLLCVMSRERGLTLVELIIAGLLVVVIIGATLSLQFANDQMYVATRAERELLQEIGVALSHLQTKVRGGYMINVDEGTSTTPQKIRISNSAQTGWSLYQWDSSSEQLWYYVDEADLLVKEIVASGISSFSISHPAPTGGKVPYFTVTIRARSSWGSILTKEIVIRDTIGARSFQGLTIRES